MSKLLALSAAVSLHPHPATESNPVNFCSVLSSNWQTEEEAGGLTKWGSMEPLEHGQVSQARKQRGSQRSPEAAGGWSASWESQGRPLAARASAWVGARGGLRASLPALAQRGRTPPLHVLTSHEARHTGPQPRHAQAARGASRNCRPQPSETQSLGVAQMQKSTLSRAQYEDGTKC